MINKNKVVYLLINKKKPLIVSTAFKNGKKYPDKNKPLLNSPAAPGSVLLGNRCKKNARPKPKKTKPNNDRVINTAIFIILVLMGV